MVVGTLMALVSLVGPQILGFAFRSGRNSNHLRLSVTYLVNIRLLLDIVVLCF